MAVAPTDIAFDQLLAALRREGFPLTPADYVEFTAVFSQFTGTREEFKYWLAPILCRNREDQQKFYILYDHYVTPPKPKRPPPEPILNPYITQNTASWFLRRASRQVYSWLILLSIVAAVVRAGVYLLAHKLRPDITVYAPISPDSVMVDSTGTAAAAPPHHQRKFVVKATRPTDATSTPAMRSLLTPRGPEVERENEVHSTAFAWLFILGLASLMLSISFFPLRQSKSVPHLDIDDSSTDHGPLDIPFQPKDQLIRDLPILARVARDLAQPLPTEHYRLDVTRTIRQSIAAHGLLTPVYTPIHRRPEYVFPINPNRVLHAGLFQYLARTFSRYSLAVHCSSSVSVDDYPLPEPLLAAFDFDPPLHDFSVAAMRDYLHDEDLFQWLCAIAVYPTVRWEMVLAVGAAVLKERGAYHKLNFISLLKLSHIEWLAAANGAIPTRTRLELLKNLGLAEELATRRTILELLRESDGLLIAGTAGFEEKMQQVHTESFILFAHDTRRNKAYEADARKFMTAFNRKTAPDLATTLYLSNPDNRWSTPVRSAEDPKRAVNADRFINELLALKVISDPRIRSFFRNLAASFLFILLLLFLFKDALQPTGLNARLGLIDRDYPHGSITVSIPVNDCLKQMIKGHYLLVTLSNYDNNRYSQLLDIQDKDTLKAGFSGVTMSGKDSGRQAIQVILNNTLTVDCPAKQYYSAYMLEVRGDDCDVRLPAITPATGRKRVPNTMEQ